MKLKLNPEIVCENLLQLFKVFGLLDEHSKEIAGRLEVSQENYGLIMRDLMISILGDLHNQVERNTRTGELSCEENLMALKVTNSLLMGVNEEARKPLKQLLMDFYSVAFKEGQLSISKSLAQLKKEVKK